ncbi:MAG: hypothetical protein KKB90_02220 [Actinobacteria bacterium]|nr:hypothetical protein [Actinomycetota bacterium]MCG2819804.1 hypothetical protein [Actinomycetes bacterium]MBU4217762.1 hypothetical protein [Actinomycetota bacterium]MBU4357993.1 hypothetical protein [Actinomycetota bacterium]MBU4391813.1 hypothetical protein [Actinomycetota bacterium]
MRRTGAALAALLILCALLVVVGCGSPGDDAGKQVKVAIEELPTEAETTEMVDSIARLATHAGSASQEYHQELEKVKEQVEAFKKKGRKARLEYEKVMEAGAGTDYEKLARIETENIDTTVEWLDSAMSFIEDLAVAVNASGGRLDEETDAEMKSAFDRSNELLDKKSEMRVEADELMKSMGLNI